MFALPSSCSLTNQPLVLVSLSICIEYIRHDSSFGVCFVKRSRIEPVSAVYEAAFPPIPC